MSKHIDFLKRNLQNNISHIFSQKQASLFHYIADFLEFFIQPLILYFIYEISRGFPEWSMYEMFLLIATARISMGIAGITSFGIFFSNAWKIEAGYFHQVLIKPFKTAYYMILESINLHWIMDLMVGIIFFAYSIIMLELQITLIGFFSFLLIMISSCLCYFGIIGLIMNFLFTHPRSNNIIDLLFTMTNFSKYPLNIFPDYIKFGLTFIFPIALTSYYPASYFLGKSTDFISLAIFIMIGIVFAAIGTFALNNGIKKHISFGG